jgi:hypothetical protein
MGKTEYFRKTLRTLADGIASCCKSQDYSPRANLELATVVADEGTEAQFKRFLKFDERKAPHNSQQDFLAICGVVGMGRLLTQGNSEALKILRAAALIRAGACAKA